MVSGNDKVCFESCVPTFLWSAAHAWLHIDFTFKAELQFNQPSTVTHTHKVNVARTCKLGPLANTTGLWIPLIITQSKTKCSVTRNGINPAIVRVEACKQWHPPLCLANTIKRGQIFLNLTDGPIEGSIKVHCWDQWQKWHTSEVCGHPSSFLLPVETDKAIQEAIEASAT